jgi:hypothetical protein
MLSSNTVSIRLSLSTDIFSEAGETVPGLFGEVQEIIPIPEMIIRRTGRMLFIAMIFRGSYMNSPVIIAESNKLQEIFKKNYGWRAVILGFVCCLKF